MGVWIRAWGAHQESWVPHQTSWASLSSSEGPFAPSLPSLFAMMDFQRVERKAPPPNLEGTEPCTRRRSPGIQKPSCLAPPLRGHLFPALARWKLAAPSPWGPAADPHACEKGVGLFPTLHRRLYLVLELRCSRVEGGLPAVGAASPFRPGSRGCLGCKRRLRAAGRSAPSETRRAPWTPWFRLPIESAGWSPWGEVCSGWEMCKASASPRTRA